VALVRQAQYWRERCRTILKTFGLVLKGFREEMKEVERCLSGQERLLRSALEQAGKRLP
jgi:Sec-independent protein translocase protein TatA